MNVKLNLRYLVRLGVILMLTATSVASAAPAQSPAEQEQFLEIMGKYLAFSSQYVEVATDPHSVLYLAVEAISEYYQERGEGAKAIEHLRRLLADTSDRAARNILRLKLADLLKEYGQRAEALKEVEELFRENSGG
jgi:tetratricopeptide (TPR) repeat protein